MAAVVRYVNTASSAGGDGTTNATTGGNRAYASLSEWEAAEDSVDLVAAGDTHTVYCEGTAADTTSVVVSGFTTNATYYVTIITNPAQGAGRHSGKYDTGTYRIEKTSGGEQTCLLNYTLYARIIGIQVAQITPTADYASGFIDNSGSTLLSHCIAKGPSDETYTSKGFDLLNPGPTFVYNSVSSGWGSTSWGTGGYNIGGGATDDYYFYNCTAYGNAVSFDRLTGQVWCKNCISQDLLGAGNGFDGTFEAASEYNCSDDGTEPGTNGVNGEVTFVNEGAGDFHLASGDTTAKDSGTDLSSDTDLDAAFAAFSDDIDEDARSGSWDIGADEFVAAAGGNPWAIYAQQ